MARGLHQASFTDIQFVKIILSLFRRRNILLEEKNELKNLLEVAIGILCECHVGSKKILKKDDSTLIKEILKFLNDYLGNSNNSYAHLREIVNSSDQCMVVIYAIFGCYHDNLGGKSAEILLLDTGNFEQIDKIINAKISLLTKILNMTPQEKNKEALNVKKMSLILGFISHTNELSRLAIEEVASDSEDKISPGLRKIIESSVNGIAEILKLYTKKDCELPEAESLLFPSDALSMVLKSLNYSLESTGTIRDRFINQLTYLLTNLNELLSRNLCKDSIPKLKAENSESDFLVKLSKTICEEGFEEQIDKLKEAIETLRERIKSFEKSACEKGESLLLQEAGEIQKSKRGLVEGGNSNSTKSMANGSESNKTRETTEQVADFKRDIDFFSVNSTGSKKCNSLSTNSVVNASKDDLIIFKEISKIATNTTLSFENNISYLKKILSELVKECLAEQKNNYANDFFEIAQKFQSFYLKAISDFQKRETKETSFPQILKEEEISLSKSLEDKRKRFDELPGFGDEESRREKEELFNEMQLINMQIIKIEDFKSYCSNDEGYDCIAFLGKIIENLELFILSGGEDVAGFISNNTRKVEAILFLENLSNNLVSSSEHIESVKAYQSIKRSLRDVQLMGALQLASFTHSVISSLSFKKSLESKNSKLELTYSLIDALERVVFSEIDSLLKECPVSINEIKDIISKLEKGSDKKDKYDKYSEFLKWLRNIYLKNNYFFIFIEDLKIYSRIKSLLATIHILEEGYKVFSGEHRKAIEELDNFLDVIKLFLKKREEKFPQFVLSLRKDFHSTLSNLQKSIHSSKEITEISFSDPVKRSLVPLTDNQLEHIYKEIILQPPLNFSDNILRKIFSESVELSEELVNEIKDYLGSEVIDSFLLIFPKDSLNKSLNSVLEKMCLKSGVKIQDIKEYLSYEISKKIFLYLVFKKIFEKKTSEREFYKKYTRVGDAFDSLSKCLKEYGRDFSSNALRKMCQQFVRNKDESHSSSEENKLRKSVVKAIQNRCIDKISPGASCEVSAKHFMRKYDEGIMSEHTFDPNIEGRMICHCLNEELKTDVRIHFIEINKDAINSINSLKGEITTEFLRKSLMPQYRESVLVNEEVHNLNSCDSTGEGIVVLRLGEDKFSSICVPHSIMSPSINQLYGKEYRTRSTCKL